MTISIGLAVYVIVDQQYNLDRFHPENSRVFAVHSVINWEGAEQTWSKSPQMLGAVIKSDFPQISHMARVARKAAIIRNGDAVFYERLTFADPEFLEIFSFPLESGPAEALRDRDKIILSSHQAVKYFDSINPLGKTLRVIIDGDTHLFTVAGVAKPFPKTASFGFDFLLSLENLPELFGSDLKSWKNFKDEALFTFLKVPDVSSLDQVEASMENYRQVLNDANADWPVAQFRFQALPELARNSQYRLGCLACGSTPEVIIMFAVISLVLLLSACFNYINISIASSTRRLKEIALRKVIGSSRRKIVFQFIVENLVFTLMAIVLGIVLASTVVIPGMNDIFGSNDLALDLFNSPKLVAFILTLFVIVGVGSGAYPAWYISSFRSIDIFRGKERLAGKNGLTKVFLAIQFFLTFIAITSGIIFTETNSKQSAIDWGYHEQNLVVVPITHTSHYLSLEKFGRQSTLVQGVSGSKSHIASARTTAVIEFPGTKSVVDAFEVDYHYPELMGLTLVEGRFFDPDLAEDRTRAIIVNETFLRKFGIGREQLNTLRINVDGETFSIIGVVKDFFHNDFFQPISPSLFKIGNEKEFRYVTMRTEASEKDDVEAAVKALWKRQFPNVPYNGYFQDEAFDRFFESTGMLIKIMNFTAFIAIVLSGMGLFGLVSLLIIKRMKELSIRNVLGASSLDTLKLLIGQFKWLIILSVVFAAPVSYFLFDELMGQMFLGTPVTLGTLPFVSAFVILALTVLLPVFYHLRNLISVNLVENLRVD